MNLVNMATTTALAVALLATQPITADAAPGDLDSAFGTNGVVVGGSIGADAVLIQPDGKILIGGFGSLVRYETNGVLDSTFGTGGVVLFPLYNAPPWYGWMAGLTVQPDGKILVPGAVSNGGDIDFFVARLHEVDLRVRDGCSRSRFLELLATGMTRRPNPRPRGLQSPRRKNGGQVASIGC